MRAINSLQEVKLGRLGREIYLTLGVFDGMHRGHQALIRRVVDEARQRRALGVVFTFQNHPLEVLAPPYCPLRLLTPDRKLEILRGLGVDIAIMIPFTRRFARLGAREFVEDILVRRCRVRKIFCGADYRFGYEGKGDVGHLRSLGREYGFSVETIEPVEYRGMVVSSTKIRELLQEGMVDRAARLLTRPYDLVGRVKKGKGVGRTLGFPTANLDVGENVIVPAVGVYAVIGEHGKRRYGGMVNIGYSPTLGGDTFGIEIHMFDFCRKMGRKQIRIFFLKRLRSEKRFATLSKLQKQLRKDEHSARAIYDRYLRGSG
jgi:riboflavin kinase/FMN adenylyltransferase